MKTSKLLRFKRLQNYIQLCTFFDVPEYELNAIIAHPGYNTFTVPKKTGGQRQITAPGPAVKSLQYKLLPYFTEIYKTKQPTCVHGFVQRTSLVGQYHIKSNAQAHLGKKYVLNIDLQDFFHSISTERIYQLFREEPFGFRNGIATALALICCNQRLLPMGTPTSPVLSNLVCIPLDNALMEYAERNGFTYTRYADDITFSADKEITEQLTADIMETIEQQGFRVNTSKVRLQTQYGAQWVTGIKVNTILNVDRIYIRNLRAVLHDMRQRGIHQAARTYLHLKPEQELTPELLTQFRLSVRGKIDFIGFVKGKEDVVYVKYLEQFGQRQ